MGLWVQVRHQPWFGGWSQLWRSQGRLFMAFGSQNINPNLIIKPIDRLITLRNSKAHLDLKNSCTTKLNEIFTSYSRANSYPNQALAYLVNFGCLIYSISICDSRPWYAPKRFRLGNKNIWHKNLSNQWKVICDLSDGYRSRLLYNWLWYFLWLDW